MSDQKHTPGPWSVGGPNKFLNQLTIEPSIGVAYGAGAELVANANVMAAGPELYEALKELHALVLGECPSLLDEDSGGDARLCMEIEDALKKARGEA